MRVLFDTCTFLWLALDSPNFSDRARKIFLDSANDVFLSVASVWEISIKHSRGRLPLPVKPEYLIPNIRERSGIQMLDIDEDAALYVNRLAWIHRDPFDRILVAQAVVHEMVLLTADEEIRQYAVRTLW